MDIWRRPAVWVEMQQGEGPVSAGQDVERRDSRGPVGPRVIGHRDRVIREVQDEPHAFLEVFIKSDAR